MIGVLFRGLTSFFDQPQLALATMRANTPAAKTSAFALIACMLVMVVIDMTYGPLAWPHSLEPGGKRDTTVFTIAGVETVRIFAVASLVWIGTRFGLRSDATGAEALWMTVPYAIALVLFEVLQMSTWLLLLATGMNIYGPMFLIGFGGISLVLILSVRTLAPDRDWLTCLPIAAVAFFAGTFLAPLVLLVAAGFLIWDTRKA